MKIQRLSLTNVTSYGEATPFGFTPGLNIMIGPNGGGKSNLQKTLALVLSTYFIPQYEFKLNDNEAGIEILDLWNRRKLRQTLSKHLGRESEPQLVEIELAPDLADIDNIKTIGGNLDVFNEHLSIWESPRTEYPPADLVDDIADGGPFTYQIDDWEMVTPSSEAASGYLEYLRTFFIFMRLAQRVPDVHLTSPVFFFFSERTSSRRVVEVQSNQLTEAQYYQGFRSAHQAAMGENTDLMQWGAQHFARVYWKHVNAAAHRKNSTVSETFTQDPMVSQLTGYLSAMGYQWDFLTDRDSVSYSFALRRSPDEPWLTADMFSSGEREIVHFLLALFALDVRDGVILIDEPELHLHPRWQRIFLDLFQDLSPGRNNQFLIATHSPVFVTPDTVDNIIRISREESGESGRVSLGEVDLPEKRSLVRMINSQNNERVFFADKVVLVEGVMDRLAIGSLLRGVAERFKDFSAIEVVEAGGKANFAGYQELLSALATPSVVVADRDYLFEVGGEGTSELFESNKKKAKKALTGKKSLDAARFEELLQAAVAEADTDELSKFLEYVRSRTRQLRSDMDGEDKALFESEIERLRKNGVFLLRAGELDDYLPAGVSGVAGVVEMAADPHWINDVPDEALRAELAEIVALILGLPEEGRAALMKEAKEAALTFGSSGSRDAG